MPDSLLIDVIEHQDYLHVHHSGPINDMDTALQHFRSWLTHVQTSGKTLVLADLRDTSESTPHAVDRIIFFENAMGIYRQWLLQGGSAVRMAILQRPESFSDYTPGIRTALSGGLICQVFDAESAALEWLRTQHGNSA